MNSILEPSAVRMAVRCIAGEVARHGTCSCGLVDVEQRYRFDGAAEEIKRAESLTGTIRAGVKINIDPDVAKQQVFCERQSA